MPNESAQEIAFENGELNIMRVSTVDKYEKYAADDRYELVTLDEGRINYMGFNANSELMKDIEARKAIAAALDVSAIVEGAYGSEGCLQFRQKRYSVNKISTMKILMDMNTILKKQRN